MFTDHFNVFLLLSHVTNLGKMTFQAYQTHCNGIYHAEMVLEIKTRNQVRTV